jgi:hypothetical protein
MQNFLVVRRILQMRPRGERKTQSERKNQKNCNFPVGNHFKRLTGLQAALILIGFLDHLHEIRGVLTQKILIESGKIKQILESGQCWMDWMGTCQISADGNQLQVWQTIPSVDI